MKARYRITRRGNRGDTLYCVDSKTGKRISLHTGDEDAAQQIIDAKNQAERQPLINLQLAKAYLAGADGGMTTRTWRDALDQLIATKQGANQERWLRAAKDRAFQPLLPRVIVESTGEQLLAVLRSGKVSTNVHLRRLHNFCLDMNWLPWPLVAKRQWPVLRFKEKRAITREEHEKIVARERNPERKAFYELLWHVAAAQTDLANLQATDVDWANRVIAFFRKKTDSLTQVRFGDEVARILEQRPRIGPLFPYLRGADSRERANEFRERCRGLGISGITLHSYRYAWAERAKIAGYPERFAQLALGHNSKAVHRAYARKARVTLPPLEDYERKADATIVQLPIAAVG